MSTETTALETPVRSARMPRHARRAQLLTAAQEVFVDMGYHTAGMDDIAERAGVSKPVLYQHFPGKRDLYLALIEQTHQQLREIITTTMAHSTDCRNRVYNAIHAFFQFITTEGSAYRLVFESDMISDPEVGEYLQEFNDYVVTVVGDQLLRDGVASVEAARLLASSVIGMAENVARYWMRNPGEIDRSTAINLVSTLAWGGFDSILQKYAASAPIEQHFGSPA